MARYGLGPLTSAAVVLAGLLAGAMPAAAQGGVICQYGPSEYRQCCRDSFRQSPNLGPAARADDIEACMRGGTRRSERQPPRENRPSPAPQQAAPQQPAVQQAAPQQAAPPPVAPTQSAAGGSAIRRLDCAAGGCEKGCGGDEMAISAFCNAGAWPTMYSDGSVRCTRDNAAEWPTVMFCARK